MRQKRILINLWLQLVLTTRLLVTWFCVVVCYSIWDKLHMLSHFSFCETHPLVRLHKHTVSLSSPCGESAHTFDLVSLVVYISPQAENHYIHFVSRYTCHAVASSDPRESKVWVMPPELVLICMRAGSALWCNCSSGEGQCLCLVCAQYQSPDVHTALKFLYGNLCAFLRWRMTLLIGV